VLELLESPFENGRFRHKKRYLALVAWTALGLPLCALVALFCPGIPLAALEVPRWATLVAVYLGAVALFVAIRT